MPIGILFWVLMLLWFFFGLWSDRGNIQAGNWAPFGGNLLLFVLLGLLGWRLFGPVLQ